MKTLDSPFRGTIFEIMRDEAVDVVTNHLARSFSAIEFPKEYLHDSAQTVMLALLQFTAFEGYAPYAYGRDNSLLLSALVHETGLKYEMVETVVSEIMTDDANGEIASWFSNPSRTVQEAQRSKAASDALKPSFFQRVLGTIAAPLGIDGSTAMTLLYIIAGLAALIALAYIYRSFKG